MGLLMMNGIPYAGYTAPPEIYSLEEREVGVWIDGKPLYQKSVYCGNLPTGTNANTTAMGISNIDNVVDIRVIGKKDSNNFITVPVSLCSRTLDLQNSYGIDIQGYDKTTDIVRIDLGSLAVLNNTYVTMYYTKTTDTAGSGKWTTSGVPTHHYSTDEQVIGTWIDGKPLYEKTYINSGSDIIANSGSWTSICSESWASSVKQIVDGKLSRQAYSSTSAGLLTPCEFIAENNVIKINPFRNLTFKTNAFFVIQYTKTTD